MQAAIASHFRGTLPDEFTTDNTTASSAHKLDDSLCALFVHVVGSNNYAEAFSTLLSQNEKPFARTRNTRTRRYRLFHFAVAVRLSEIALETQNGKLNPLTAGFSRKRARSAHTKTAYAHAEL